MRLVRLLFLLLIFLAASQFTASADCCLEETTTTYPRYGGSITFDFRAGCGDAISAVLAHEDYDNCWFQPSPECDPWSYIDGRAVADSGDISDYVISIRRRWIAAGAGGTCPASSGNTTYQFYPYGTGGGSPFGEVRFFGLTGDVTVTWLDPGQLAACLACIVCLIDDVVEALPINSTVVDIVMQALSDDLSDASNDDQDWHSSIMPDCPIP